MRSKTPSSNIFSRIDIALGLMACVSLIILLLPRAWFTHTLTLNPLDYPANLFNDFYSNGNSKVRWINKETQAWQCELGNAYGTPYCSILYKLIDERGRGLNLSNYNHMKIWLNYQGNAGHIRIYLRNRNPKYFDLSNISTTKYNTVEVPVKELADGLDIKMSDFRVAEWWLVQNNIALSESHPEFNDVIYLEIQTGSEARNGLHDFVLRRVQFTGVLFSQESLYKALVIIWSGLILLLLLYRLLRLKIQLNKNLAYQKELVSINRLLNLQNKQFEDLARTDPLTGLLNRIGIREALFNGLKNWKESRRPFSFIMIDIDHFKLINDTHGHDVGDKVLQSVARLFSESVRKTDFLARWGGEEFILVCPDTDLEQSHIVAELLRQRLANNKIHADVTVTASFGVASMTQPDLDSLFKAADDALYKAKNQGRNCVMVQQPAPDAH